MSPVARSGSASLARRERAALCDDALSAGAEAPTLCEGWTVKDLVVHLLVRESDLFGATGIVVGRLSGATARAHRRYDGEPLDALVARLRQGPPVWWPSRLPAVDRALNTLEFFVHHEDIRRAQPGWEPRELSASDQRDLWGPLKVAGRGTLGRKGVPVRIESPGHPSATLRSGDDPVVVSGPVAEVTLFCYGRDQVRGLDVTGPDQAVARLRA